MADAAQARFNPTDDNWNMLVGFFTALRINGDGSIWTFTANITGSVSIIMAEFFVSGITINHRIHVASSDAEIQIRFA